MEAISADFLSLRNLCTGWWSRKTLSAKATFNQSSEAMWLLRSYRWQREGVSSTYTSPNISSESCSTIKWWFCSSRNNNCFDARICFGWTRWTEQSTATIIYLSKSSLNESNGLEMEGPKWANILREIYCWLLRLPVPPVKKEKNLQLSGNCVILSDVRIERARIHPSGSIRENFATYSELYGWPQCLHFCISNRLWGSFSRWKVAK
jgi:hypothetical protein